MSAAKKQNPARVAMIAKVKIGQKELAWPDDVYRDVLRQRFNKDSAAKLSDSQLHDLVKYMKGCGFKPKPAKRKPGRAMAESPGAKKIRALWLSLYHLGVVKDPSEKALSAFAKRTTKSATPDGEGVQALQWITAQQAWQVIEALKAWGTRSGVEWSHVDGERAAVIVAQWSKLKATGRTPKSIGAFQTMLRKHGGQMGLFALSDSEKDSVIAALGEKIRGAAS